MSGVFSRRGALQAATRYFCSKPRKTKYSYCFRPGDFVLSDATLGDLVDKSADEVGDRTAFVSQHQGVEMTYTEFKRTVDRLASGFLALGLSKGDRIGLCSPNTIEWPITQYAAAKAGLVLVNINPAYQKDELEYCLNKVGCKALVSADKFKTQNFYELLCAIMPELPSSKPGDVCSSKLKSLKTVILTGENAQSGTFTFEEVLKAGGSESDKLLGSIQQGVQFDDAVNIQFTSGTTGRPKGAVLSHHNIVNNALVSSRRMAYHQHTPVVCCQVPLYHCFGCVLGSIGSVLYRHTCIFPSAGFDAVASIKTVLERKCTSIYGTPTMFVDILGNYKPSEQPISTLEHAVIGGAPCPVDVLKQINEVLGVKHLHLAYGSTENSPAVAVSGMDESVSDVCSGFIPPLEYLEMKVINHKGQVVPIGEQGELCTRGHILFLGYWEQKDKTDEVVDQNNWYHTGDLSRMNENGYVQIVGRIKDMVLRGGENLYPAEIEDFLHTHEAILEAHVCGVPDKRLGEELCAWIKPREGKKLSEDEVKAFCKGKISHFKIPRYIMFVDEFPKTISGKIQKFKMREMSIQKLGLSS